MKVIKYYADWCGPCQEYNKVWQEAKSNYEWKGIAFIDYNIEHDVEHKALLELAHDGKQIIPTTLFIQDDGSVEVAKGPLSINQIARRLN